MIDEKPFLTLASDRIFKAIILDGEDYKVLENILSDILEEDIEVINVLNSELIPLNKGIKVQTVVNVEVNSKFDKTIIRRNLFYYTSIYSQMNKRDKIKNIKKVIQVNLNYNNYGRELKEEIVLMNKKSGKIYDDSFKIINVNALEVQKVMV